MILPGMRAPEVLQALAQRGEAVAQRPAGTDWPASARPGPSRSARASRLRRARRRRRACAAHARRAGRGCRGPGTLSATNTQPCLLPAHVLAVFTPLPGELGSSPNCRKGAARRCSRSSGCLQSLHSLSPGMQEKGMADARELRLALAAASRRCRRSACSSRCRRRARRRRAARALIWSITASSRAISASV